MPTTARKNSIIMHSISGTVQAASQLAIILILAKIAMEKLFLMFST